MTYIIILWVLELVVFMVMLEYGGGDDFSDDDRVWRFFVVGVVFCCCLWFLIIVWCLDDKVKDNGDVTMMDKNIGVSNGGSGGGIIPRGRAYTSTVADGSMLADNV